MTENDWQSRFDKDISADPEAMPAAMPQMWELTKRYILRGAPQFQWAGLEILAELVSHFPVDEALETVEQYFRQNEYLPGGSMRGGLTLSPFKAAYAVATAYEFIYSKLPISKAERHRRVIALLNETLNRCISSRDEVLRQDARIVERTIDAIKADTPAYEPSYSSADEGIQDQVEPSAVTELHVPAPDQSSAREKGLVPPTVDSPQLSQLTREEMLQVVDERLERFKRDAALDKVTPMDIIVAQHGLDTLAQKVTAIEMNLNLRVDNMEKLLGAMDKSIDRNIGQSQVTWAKWAVVIAVIALLFAVGVACWPLIAPFIGAGRTT